MKIQVYLKIIFLLILFGCVKETPPVVVPNIIPKPLSQEIKEGVFTLDKNTFLEYSKEHEKVAIFLTDYFKENLNIVLSTENKESKIKFITDNTILNDEGYLLKIAKNQILISAKTTKGIFYAVQSLIQLLPLKSNLKQISIQNLEIKDEPQFSYRGMHLDVARHFFPVAFIKKFINLMSILKMNNFHWHLTDDQGWRIEIKKYPKLQEIAAYRKETLIGHYSDEPHQFNGKKYGGYYTQKDIKEIVKYASDRQITIIPEIEMPGHSQAAIAAYPELGCTLLSSSRNKIEVATKWGIFEDIYCPKESTFKFLEDVIDEVVALFPGKYIHIGGDEAPKINWEKCENCQILIKKEGLKDEHELQSYFITRMEKYINSKGKQIIGWDEILEGGLAPNATVMSWRGTNGAVIAAKQKHDVILTPQSHCYLNHYQSDNKNEPLTNGGYLPLQKVYSFNPIPPELTKKESKYVLGAQGNIWTEYITNPKKIEYMAFPRAIALSEVIWSDYKNKNYSDFINRLEHFNKRLDVMNVNYSNHIYDIKGKLIDENGKLFFELKSTSNKFDIFYSKDGSNPKTLYEEPILIDSTMHIKAQVYKSGMIKKGNPFEQKINLHKAVGSKISLNVTPHKAYNTGGKQALINGISGNDKRYGDTEWLGFSGDDIEITIEFDEPTEINSISTRFHNGNGQWIYAPKEIKFSFQLEDEKTVNYTEQINNRDSLLVNFNYKIKATKIIKMKMMIKNYGEIPEGKQGAGNKSWTFIDEIIIE